MKKIEKIFAVLILLLLLGFFAKLTTSPDKNDLEKIVLNMLNNPVTCEKSSPEQFIRMIKLDWKNSAMRLKLKANHLPKRIDYFAVNSTGEVVAEIAYRVNAKCQGVFIELFDSPVQLNH